MFVPVEGVFQFIVENELELKTKNVDIYDEAMEKKVILVPPSLLLVYLSTIRVPLILLIYKIKQRT